MEEWQNPTTIAAWILIAVLFMGMLVVSMILLIRSGFRKVERVKLEGQIRELEHEQELLKTQIDASEQEKQRIASDLHDHFGVSLSTLKLKVHQLNSVPVEEHSTFLEGIDHLLEKNINDMRDLSHGIYPPMLKEWGIEPALKELAFDLREQAAISIVQTGLEFSTDDWAILQLYRICQEFVHNSIRHGKAQKIKIHIRGSVTGTSVLLQDDGCGFDVKNLRKGAGLISLDMRCKAMGAKNYLRSRIGKGTTILLFIPTKA